MSNFITYLSIIIIYVIPIEPTSYVVNIENIMNIMNEIEHHGKQRNEGFNYISSIDITVILANAFMASIANIFQSN